MFRRARAGVGTRRGSSEMSAFTAVPRWTLDPVPGTGEYEAQVPGELATALRILASAQSVPLSAVWLAAHAKVLGALAGEQEVCTGYASAEVTLPCPMTLARRTWREVLVGIARAEAALLGSRDTDRAAPSFETVFEPVFEPAVRGGGGLGAGIVLRVAFAERDGLALRLRYRTDVLDADLAARIAGYHLTALALIAADPDAEHARQTLLSAEELRFQLRGLAGERRELPDRHVHELFEERVQERPDAIAAMRGHTKWTYRELNARANQLARALL